MDWYFELYFVSHVIHGARGLFTELLVFCLAEVAEVRCSILGTHEIMLFHVQIKRI